MEKISRDDRPDKEEMEADETLLRSDDDYLEIEQFKEYEFSWCIAFEMAKRNRDLLEDVNRFIKYYNRWKSYIDFISFSHDEFENSFEYRIHRKAKVAFELGYDYLSQKYWLAPIDLYYITFDETALEMVEVYVHQFKDIQEQQSNELFTIDEEDGVMVESSVYFKNEHFFQDNQSITNGEILEAIDEYDIDPALIESERKITENFSRPKLFIPPMLNKNVQIELNLALPEKELLAYISYIKKKYDEDKGFLKSSIELLGSDLEAAGLEEVDSNDMYKRDRRKTLQEKCADMFFIYDCNVNGVTANKTIESLNNYWGWERDFPTLFQIKTHRRYLKLATDFIENRKYQSLLIGI